MLSIKRSLHFRTDWCLFILIIAVVTLRTIQHRISYVQDTWYRIQDTWYVHIQDTWYVQDTGTRYETVGWIIPVSYLYRIHIAEEVVTEKASSQSMRS